MTAPTIAPRPARSHRQLFCLQSRCKNALNVFNAIPALFSVFVGADPLFSTPSKLFLPKQGGKGIAMLPKSFSVSYSRYPQCYQQNTISLHFFLQRRPFVFITL